jgi:hypothetical protein
MKVKFDATFEDFVDVSLRSAQPSWISYVVILIAIVGCSGAISVLLHWAFESWFVTLGAAIGGCIAGAYALIEAPDRSVRNHLKKQVDPETSVPTEVEISEIGVSTKCLGHSLVQEWSTIERIEETDDAIYFRNKFGQYCSARKRGFASKEEMNEFLKLARTWHEQTK